MDERGHAWRQESEDREGEGDKDREGRVRYLTVTQIC